MVINKPHVQVIPKTWTSQPVPPEYNRLISHQPDAADVTSQNEAPPHLIHTLTCLSLFLETQPTWRRRINGFPRQDQERFIRPKTVFTCWLHAIFPGPFPRSLQHLHHTKWWILCFHICLCFYVSDRPISLEMVFCVWMALDGVACPHRNRNTRQFPGEPRVIQHSVLYLPVHVTYWLYESFQTFCCTRELLFLLLFLSSLLAIIRHVAASSQIPILHFGPSPTLNSSIQKVRASRPSFGAVSTGLLLFQLVSSMRPVDPSQAWSSPEIW